jgi:protein-S-isoprenylcysteine O-methyltransferase Ste14
VGERWVWRWKNVPVPEPHVAGLAVCLLLHRARPRSLGAGAATRAGGAVLLMVGTGVVAWATVSAGQNDLEQPDRLVTEGAYRHSRNPMYVGWTLAYLGVGALGGSAWPVILLPGVAVAMDRHVRHEEARLAARFGNDFCRYAGRVRRYL